MFPTTVGMNRFVADERFDPDHVPYERGDEPV